MYSNKKTKGMFSAKGIYSYKGNPAAMPSMTPRLSGKPIMGGNSDLDKVRRMHAQTYKEVDSLRGKGGA